MISKNVNIYTNQEIKIRKLSDKKTKYSIEKYIGNG